MSSTLEDEVDKVLADAALFETLTHSAFEKCTKAFTQGGSDEVETSNAYNNRVNFPQVSKIIENLLIASGEREVHFNHVHDIWRRYCDPVTSDMDEQRFSTFASKMLSALQAKARRAKFPLKRDTDEKTECISGTASTTSVEVQGVLPSPRLNPSTLEPHVIFPQFQHDKLAEYFTQNFDARWPSTPELADFAEPLPLATFHDSLDSALAGAYSLARHIESNKRSLTIQDIPGLTNSSDGRSETDPTKLELISDDVSLALPCAYSGPSVANALAIVKTLPDFPRFLFPPEGWDSNLRRLGIHVIHLAGKYAVLPGISMPLVAEATHRTPSGAGFYLWTVLCEQALLALVGEDQLRRSLTEDVLRDISDVYWVDRVKLNTELWRDSVREHLTLGDSKMFAWPASSAKPPTADNSDGDRLTVVSGIDGEKVTVTCSIRGEDCEDIDLDSFCNSFDSITTVFTIPPRARRWTFRGQFTCDTTGGTPIPIRQPVPGSTNREFTVSSDQTAGTPESWGRNPMFLVEMPSGPSDSMDIMVMFSQHPRKAGELEEVSEDGDAGHWGRILGLSRRTVVRNARH
ncbi:hypothetical protein FOL47_010133 [Perkinsus chesapeaki]|uniref:Uncharacterized protein n=1 Tax=Perkinsus chesapeaki TaxID=330153 RepID=A0A7J6MQ85_PERCH|nr:hypothetical protein FOL47_010133 [Perkinsus chesapeaki]